jgi:integrase-like protein
MAIVETYLTDWLHVCFEVHCKKTTAHGYRTMFNQHVLPVFGDRKLDEVTPCRFKLTSWPVFHTLVTPWLS